MSELVLIDDVDGVRTITLNRPEARNAFNRDLYEATGVALAAADADDHVKVVVVKGAGKGFSAGQDLREIANVEGPGDGKPAGPHGFGTFIRAIEQLRKPVIAAVHGHAIGIGVTMLPYFDLVVVADDAQLRMPFVSLGIVPEAGSSVTMPNLLGRQLASYLLLSGDVLDGAAAVRGGLALRSVPAAELDADVAALGAQLAALPLPSLMGTKQLLREGWLEPVQAARAREEVIFGQLLGRGASKDALDAFLRR